MKLINYMMKRLIDVVTADITPIEKIEKLESLALASGKLADEIENGFLIKNEMYAAITVALVDGYDAHQ